jgi:hypothetical protein
MLMSPISSKKIVPWCASSKRPIRRALASVNAPASWPKSSLSSSCPDIAAQLTMTGQDRVKAFLFGARQPGLGGCRGLDLISL